MTATLDRIIVHKPTPTRQTRPIVAPTDEELVLREFPKPIAPHKIRSIKEIEFRAQSHPLRWSLWHYRAENPFLVLLFTLGAAGFIGIFNFFIASVVYPGEVLLHLSVGISMSVFIGATGTLIWYHRLPLGLWYETPYEWFRGMMPPNIRERVEELRLRAPKVSWVVHHIGPDPILEAILPNGQRIFAAKW